MKNIIGIIPARYASTRFPGKPLIDIGGKSMIRRVYEQALKADLRQVVVATDDERIADHVKSFKGEVVMTDPAHQSGTDRCAEVMEKTGSKATIIINIQGDEPFIDPQQINKLADLFDAHTAIATLMKKISSEEEIRNPNVVKVVFNTNKEAVYFSRSAIPYRRSPEAHIDYFKHIGIYGYSAEALQRITRLPVSMLEKAESLEQLRWISAGYTISLAETDIENIAIDTPEDLQKALVFLSK